MKMNKKLSASGKLPPDPAMGCSALRPRYKLAFRALQHGPPLANHGTATGEKSAAYCLDHPV